MTIEGVDRSVLAGLTGTERRRAYDREWRRVDRANNPERYRAIDLLKVERSKQRYPDKERARAQRSFAKDPWKVARSAFKNARTRALRWGQDVGDLTMEIFARLHLLPCAYCGAMPAGSTDHVVPLSRGGPNNLANLVPACDSCNKRKADQLDWTPA